MIFTEIYSTVLIKGFAIYTAGLVYFWDSRAFLWVSIGVEDWLFFWFNFCMFWEAPGLDIG